MGNDARLYPAAISQLTDPAATDWSSATIKVALVTSAYTYSAAHDFFDDVTNELSGSGYTAGGATLASKTEAVASGVRTYDAADPVWASLAGAAGTPAAMIVYRDTGVASTSPLLAYLELPGVAPDGGDYTITLPALGLIRIAAGHAIQWLNLSEYMGLHVDMSTPTYDPNSVFSSLTSDATGTTLAVGNATSVDGFNEGASVVIGVATDVIPNFDDVANEHILVRGTVVTGNGSSKNYWQAIMLTATATGSTTLGYAIGYKTLSASGRPSTHSSTADNTTGSGDSITYCLGGFILAAPVTGTGPAFFYNSGDPGSAGNGGTISNMGTIGSRTLYLRIVGGCETSTNDGPHSAKILWEIASVPVT